jgi:hypothetical protein
MVFDLRYLCGFISQGLPCGSGDCTLVGRALEEEKLKELGQPPLKSDRSSSKLKQAPTKPHWPLDKLKYHASKPFLPLPKLKSAPSKLGWDLEKLK